MRLSTGIGTNGLVTVAIWWLFTRFVRFKANGHLPDEVLHYSFGWLALTVYLPNFTVALAWPWSLLPLIGFGVTFERVLHLSAATSPRREFPGDCCSCARSAMVACDRTCWMRSTPRGAGSARSIP